MSSNPNSGSDVLQSHDHAKLSAEEIAKAVARHNKSHKGESKDAPGQNPKGDQKKPGKR